MAEYLITKREKCDHSASTAGALAPCNICCKDGYAHWEVPLIDVLKKVRWDDLRGERGYLGPYVSSDGLRIEDD